MSPEPPYDFHAPVLIGEVLKHLPIVPDGIYVDGTLGGGGYAAPVLAMLPPGARLIGFDLDADAIHHAGERLHAIADRILFIHDNFKALPNRLRAAGINHIDCLLLDLGVSSHQIDVHERGFSFRSSDTPARLDMRMDARQRLTAHTVINTYPQERLAEIFSTYGEERYSRRIAQMVVRARERAPIETTNDLAAIVEIAIGQRMLTKSLARVFQAIRIEVNDELENLSSVLASATELMAPGGRLMVISYHSLEDRIVKQFIREKARRLIPSGNKLVPDTIIQPVVNDLAHKPIVAGEEEISINPRARSAKLRIAEKL